MKRCGGVGCPVPGGRDHMSGIAVTDSKLTNKRQLNRRTRRITPKKPRVIIKMQFTFLVNRISLQAFDLSACIGG